MYVFMYVRYDPGEMLNVKKQHIQTVSHVMNEIYTYMLKNS